MGCSLGAKRQVHTTQRADGTLLQTGAGMTKPRDDSVFLQDREIQSLDAFLLIWLYSNVDRTDQIHTIIQHLQKVVKHTNLLECDNFKRWLTKYKGGKKIVLLVSVASGKKIVPSVHDSASIIAIYVYSSDYIIDDRWIHDHWKVRDVASDGNEFVRRLIRDLTYIKRMEDSNNQSGLRTTSFDDRLTSQMNEKLNKNLIQAASQLSILFILIGLSTHLNRLASAMLDTLRSLTKDSILIFENSSVINFDELPKKTIFLFVSSEFAATLKSKLKQTEAIFILEDDKSKADQRERFSTSEDLMCQLADEIYRCYVEDASDYMLLGDLSMAEIKVEQARKIQSELKKVHAKYFVSNNTTEASTSMKATTTILVWLKSKLQNAVEMEKVKKLFSKAVSSFLVFDNQFDCHTYLLPNKFANTVFLIIGNDYEDSIVADFQQLPNVRGVYRYGRLSSKHDTIIDHYHDLCSQLTSDLIAHYNRLGSDYSTKQDAKTARDNFMKAYELCDIFSKI